MKPASYQENYLVREKPFAIRERHLEKQRSKQEEKKNQRAQQTNKKNSNKKNTEQK